MYSTETVARLLVVFRRVARDAVVVLRGVAFWTAVVLPLVFLWLVRNDASALTDPGTLLGLTTLNVVCLLVGHGHATSEHHHD